MSTLEYRLLDHAEITMGLADLEGWEIEAATLIRTFHFGSYKDGLLFAAAVGYLADRMNHHPDLYIGYQKVSVGLSTHDVGGLSPFDLALAKEIQNLL